MVTEVLVFGDAKDNKDTGTPVKNGTIGSRKIRVLILASYR
jgi:hypothetical protein